MPNISTQLSDLAIIRSLLIQRVSNGLSSKVARAYQDMIDQIDKDIRSAKPITLRNMTATIKELKERFEVDVSFLNKELEDLAVTESAFALNSVNSTVGVDVFSKVPPEATIRNLVSVSLMSSGSGAATIRGWTKSVEDRSIDDIDKIIKLGVTSGETNEEIATRLVNKLGSNKKEAMKITRTATSHISNVAREAVYEANSEVIRGYQKHETLDLRTCKQCAAIDGEFFPLGKPKPPATLHMNCRGVYVVVLKSWEDLGLPFDEIPAGTRSSLDGAISSKINFEEWILGKDEPTIKKWFGAGRYKLYKENKLKLDDFVNQSGDILTVTELKEKYS